MITWIVSFGVIRIIGIGACLAGAGAYGYLMVEQRQTKQEVTRITRVVEGTPGEPGEAGEPGIGVRRVILNTIPSGSNPSVKLRNQVMTLNLPRGPMGLQGPRGLRGLRGPIGNTGVQGDQGQVGPQGPTGPAGNVNTALISALINSFMRSHTFTCTRVGVITYTCRVTGGG